MHYIVDISILPCTLDNPAVFKGGIKPSLGTAHDYVAAINMIKKECKIKDPLTLKMLIGLPNIFNFDDAGLDTQSAQTITQATHDLIATVIQERTKEGKQLKKDLEKRLACMKKEIAIIEKTIQRTRSRTKRKA